MTHLKTTEAAINCQEMQSDEQVWSFQLFPQATTQNLKTTGSVRIKLQTSPTADTITKPQKTIANYKYLRQKAFTNDCAALELQ